VARIYPTGGWPEIQAIVAYMVWIALWDDEIDYAKSEIATSKVKTEDHCTRSLSFIKNVFGLDATEQVDAPFAFLPLIKGFTDPIANSASLGLRGNCQPILYVANRYRPEKACLSGARALCVSS
jgi:hypothetical protein